jgi:hypothetical protein
MRRWFDVLLKKAKQSYNQLIVVKDMDQLGRDKLFVDVLCQHFAVTIYEGEISLRQFIRQHPNQQILILVQKPFLSLPYDVEKNADLINWTLSDVFPRFDSKALKRFETSDYQSIFDTYIEVEDSLPIQDENQTSLMIREWIRSGQVIAEEKGYYDQVSSTGEGQKIALWNEGIASEERYVQLETEIKQLVFHTKPDWQQIAMLWGELELLYPTEELIYAERYFQLDQEVSYQFQQFIRREYDQLFFASFKNGPITINQTMSYLGTLESKKIALLCFDGMGFAEWIGLKSYLQENRIMKYKERATFALIPSLTSISRKALFTGVISMDQMEAESTGFIRTVELYFPWGKDANKRLFINTNGRWNRDYLGYDVLGIVFDIIDKAGHNSILFAKSKKSMHQQLKYLYKQTQIDLIISTLLDEGYRVFITADHGSIWCCGNGIRADRYLAEERAMRALIYPNLKLAEEFASKHDLELLQNQRILGERVLVLPKGRDMYNMQGKIAISHGAAHIEEVIIPFVEVFS